MSINREMWSAIGTITASIIALGGYGFSWWQDKERRKFETKQRYYDENILKTIIPIKALNLERFLEQEGDKLLLNVWSDCDLFLKIESINNGLTRKHSGIKVFKNPTNEMKNTLSHRDYELICLKSGGNLIKKSIKILEEYPTKIHCIEEALKICNATIIY